MKTLADLKRNTRLYEWSIYENTWLTKVPAYQREYRKVSHVKDEGFALITYKDGVQCDCWTYYPRACEVSIKPIEDSDGATYVVIITRIARDREHTMIWKLRPVNINEKQKGETKSE